MLNQLCRLKGGAFRLVRDAATLSAASLALFGAVLLLSAALPSGPARAQCMGTIDGGDNTVDCSSGSDAGTIDLQGGNDTLNMSGTYTVGNISIFGGDGNDTVNITGGSFDLMAGGSLLIGGQFAQLNSAGNDTLNFDGFVGRLPAGVSNWDTINVVNGANIVYRDGNGYSVFLDDSNAGALFNIDASSTVSVAADGNALNDAKFTNIGAGEFRLNGTVALSNNEIGDLFIVQSQMGNGTVSGSGTVTVDVLIDDLITGPNMGTGGSDVFWVAGATINPGTSIGLQANIVGIGPNGFTDELIPLAINQGPIVQDPNSFYLVGGQITAGNYVYDLVYDEDFFMDWDQWALRNLGPTPDLGTYATNVTIAQRTWAANIRTMRERMGYLHGEAPAQDLFAASQGMQYASLNDAAADADPLGRQSAAAMEEGEAHGREVGVSLWVNGTFDSTNDQGDGGGDIGYRSTTTGVTAGADMALGSPFGGGDRLFLGLFAGYGDTQADFDDGLGTLDLTGTMLGAYATYTVAGFYLDFVVSYQSLNFETYNTTTTGTANYDGSAWGGSLEAGYRIDLGGFDIEPQVQLTYVNVSHESFVDSMGASVEDDEGHSLQLRGGLRASTSFKLDEGVMLRPYVDLGVIHEFADANDVVVLGTTMSDALYDTAYEVGGGAALSLPGGMQVFIDVDYRGASDYSSVNGVLGLRLSF